MADGSNKLSDLRKTDRRCIFIITASKLIGLDDLIQEVNEMNVKQNSYTGLASADLTCADLVRNYIDEIWNHQRFDRLNDYLAEDVVDHSLPPSFPKGPAGVQAWITATAAVFDEQQIIEDQVTDEQAGKSVTRVTLRVKHIGEWRGIAPTHKTVDVPGYRMFQIENGRIVEMWAQMDGEGLERALRAA